MTRRYRAPSCSWLRFTTSLYKMWCPETRKGNRESILSQRINCSRHRSISLKLTACLCQLIKTKKFRAARWSRCRKYSWHLKTIKKTWLQKTPPSILKRSSRSSSSSSKSPLAQIGASTRSTSKFWAIWPSRQKTRRKPAKSTWSKSLDLPKAQRRHCQSKRRLRSVSQISSQMWQITTRENTSTQKWLRKSWSQTPPSSGSFGCTSWSICCRRFLPDILSRFTAKLSSRLRTSSFSRCSYNTLNCSR